MADVITLLDALLEAAQQGAGRTGQGPGCLLLLVPGPLLPHQAALDPQNVGPPKAWVPGRLTQSILWTGWLCCSDATVMSAV